MSFLCAQRTVGCSLRERNGNSSKRLENEVKKAKKEEKGREGGREVTPCF